MLASQPLSYTLNPCRKLKELQQPTAYDQQHRQHRPIASLPSVSKLLVGFSWSLPELYLSTNYFFFCLALKNRPKGDILHNYLHCAANPPTVVGQKVSHL
jgi:hypothetical protein